MTKDVSRYREAFLNEARVYLETMNKALLELEKSPGNSALIFDIFRAIHTLKSMSAAMEFQQLAKLCHALEDLMEAIKKGTLKIERVVDNLFSNFDFIRDCLQSIEDSNLEISIGQRIEIINAFIKEPLEGLEEIQTAVPEGKSPESSIEKIKSIEVKVASLDTLLKLSEELLVNKMKLELLRDELNNPELSAIVEILGRTITDLQYNVMQVRMVSLDFVFNQFPRMVRDLARVQNKNIELVIEGGEIEVDRSILDEVSESLVHLLRNAIDHGIETVEERRNNGKPSTAILKIQAIRTKESVNINIMDDGRGLDLAEIKSIGIEHGLLKENDSDDKIINALFAGVSTSKKITDISGRGMGLRIVKDKVDSMDGTIKVDSKPGMGTTFSIDIPLSLAVIKALFVRIKEKIYAIPVMSIERLLLLEQNDLKAMLQAESVIIDNENIPLLRLRCLFHGDRNSAQKQPVVVVRQKFRKLGLIVDELLVSQDIVIKPLSRTIKENRYFSGSAIIGSGEIVLIIDVAHLAESQAEFHT